MGFPTPILIFIQLQVAWVQGRYEAMWLGLPFDPRLMDVIPT